VDELVQFDVRIDCNDLSIEVCEVEFSCGGKTTDCGRTHYGITT